MPSQGPQNPSDAEDVGGGSFSWSNPENVFSSDGNYATADLNAFGATNGLLANDFGFTLPDGATIDGIELEIQRKSSHENYHRDQASGVHVWQGETFDTSGKGDTVTTYPTDDEYAIYGGPGDLWGLSWDSSDINSSDFGVSLQAINLISGSSTVYINHLRVTVYYTVNEADAPPVAMQVTAVAPTGAKSAASGQGLVDLTAVAPTQGGISADMPFDDLEIRGVSAAALTIAHVPPQPIEITPLAPVPAVSWTSAVANPLELTAPAPTVTFSASSGQGLVDLTAPAVAGTQNAAAAAIGEIGFSRGLPTTTKAVAAGQGLIDVTPVAATGSKAVLHEFGRVWFAQPEVTINFLAASGQGLIDVVAPSITPQHASLAPVVAAVGAVPAATTSHDAPSGIGLVDFVPVAPASSKDAASGQGLVDLVHVTFTSSHEADSGPVVVELLPASPETTKSVAGLEVGLWDLVHAAAAGSHDAAAGLGLIELAVVSPETTKDAALPFGAVDLVAASVDPTHAAAAGMGTVDFAVVTPATPKEAALETVIIVLAAPDIGLLTRKWAVTATLSANRTEATLAVPSTTATLTTNPTEATLGEVVFW
jgi:hypothetical protein